VSNPCCVATAYESAGTNDSVRVLVDRLVELLARRGVQLRGVEPDSQIERQTVGLGRKRNPDAPERPYRFEPRRAAGRGAEAAFRQRLAHELRGIHVDEPELARRKCGDGVLETPVVRQVRGGALGHVDHPGEADRVVADDHHVIHDRVAHQRGAASEYVQRDAPVLARLLVAERFGHPLLEGRLRRAVVIAVEQRRGRDDVVIGAEVEHDRRLRPQPGQHVLVCETRALEQPVERGVHLLPEVLIAADRGEAVREGEQVHLLAGGGVEVHRRDHLARGRNKLQELLARAAHQEEGGGGGTTSEDDQPRGDDREQAPAAMARGRWRILGLGS